MGDFLGKMRQFCWSGATPLLPIPAVSWGGVIADGIAGEDQPIENEEERLWNWK